jgi:hypothetical protein
LLLLLFLPGAAGCGVITLADMQFPDTEFTEKDDGRAIAILTKLGIIGRFGDEPLRKRHMTMVTFSDHATHWIIGCRFSGHPNPAYNGFVVHGMPKSKCSQAVFEQFVQELSNRDNTGTGLLRRPKPAAE